MYYSKRDNIDQVHKMLFFIKMDVKITGLREQKEQIIQIQKETFEEWKQAIMERMEQMSQEINSAYGSLGSGGLSDGTYIKEAPNSISLNTDTMVIIWLDWGTQPHGPVTAPFLHFFIDGVEIYTKWVQGIKAHRIIQLAVDRFIAEIQGWFQG